MSYCKNHLIDYSANVPGEQSHVQAAVSRKCGCHHGRSCMCGANPDLPPKDQVQCGKCENCLRNFRSLKRTGREGKRKCLFPPRDTSNMVTVNLRSTRVTLHKDQIEFFKQKATSSELIAELSASTSSVPLGVIKESSGDPSRDSQVMMMTARSSLLDRSSSTSLEQISENSHLDQSAEEAASCPSEPSINFTKVGQVDQVGMRNVQFDSLAAIGWEHIRMMRVAKTIRSEELSNMILEKTSQLEQLEEEQRQIHEKIVLVGVDMRQHIDTKLAHNVVQRLPIEVAIKTLEEKIGVIKSQLAKAKSEQEEIEEESRLVAAKSIQRCARKYLARVLVERAEIIRVEKLKAAACRHAQRIVRGHWGRQQARVVRARRENENAQKIQRTMRGCLGRLRAGKLRIQREIDRYHAAARVIQARVRLIQNREQREVEQEQERVQEILRNFNAQANNIQRVFRGYQARKKRRARRVELSLGPRVRELCDRYIAKGDLFRFLEEVNRDYELHMAQQAELRRMEMENATTFIQQVLKHREHELERKWAEWEKQKQEMHPVEKAVKRYDRDQKFVPRALKQRGSRTVALQDRRKKPKWKQKHVRPGAIGTESRAAALPGAPFEQSKFQTNLQEKERELAKFLRKSKKRGRASETGGAYSNSFVQPARRPGTPPSHGASKDFWGSTPRQGKTQASDDDCDDGDNHNDDNAFYDERDREEEDDEEEELFKSPLNKQHPYCFDKDTSEHVLRTSPPPDVVVVPPTKVIALDPVLNRSRHGGKLSKSKSAYDIMREKTPPRVPLDVIHGNTVRGSGSSLLRMEIPSLDEGIDRLLFHAALRSYIKAGIDLNRNKPVSSKVVDAAIEKFVLVAPESLKMTVESESYEIAAVHTDALKTKGIHTCAQLQVHANRLEHDFEIPHDLACSVRSILGILSGSLENVRPSSVQEKWRKAVAGEDPSTAEKQRIEECDQGRLITRKPSTAAPSSGTAVSADQGPVEPARAMSEQQAKRPGNLAGAAASDLALLNHFPSKKPITASGARTSTASTRPYTTDTVAYPDDRGSTAGGVLPPSRQDPSHSGYSDIIDFERIGLQSSASMRYLPSRGNVMSRSQSRGGRREIGTPAESTFDGLLGRVDMPRAGADKDGMRQIPTRGENGEIDGELDTFESSWARFEMASRGASRQDMRQISTRGGESLGLDGLLDEHVKEENHQGEERYDGDDGDDDSDAEDGIKGITLAQWFSTQGERAKSSSSSEEEPKQCRPQTSDDSLYNWNWTGPLDLPDRLRPATVGDSVRPSQSRDFETVKVKFTREGADGLSARSRPASRESTGSKSRPASRESAKSRPASRESAKSRPASRESAKSRPASRESTKSRPASRESTKSRPASRESTKSRPASRESYSSSATTETVHWNVRIKTAQTRASTASSVVQMDVGIEDPEEVQAARDAAKRQRAMSQLEERVKSMALEVKMSDPIERLITHVMLRTDLGGVGFDEFLETLLDLPPEATTTSRALLKQRFRLAVSASQPYAEMVEKAGFFRVSALAACPLAALGVPAAVARESLVIFSKLANQQNFNREYDARYARSCSDPSAPGAAESLHLPPIGKKKEVSDWNRTSSPKAPAGSRREQLVHRVLSRTQSLGQYFVLEKSHEEEKLGLDFSTTYNEWKSANKIGQNTVVGTAEEIQALYNWHPFPNEK